MKTVLIILGVLAVICFALGYVFSRIAKKADEEYDKYYNQPH